MTLPIALVERWPLDRYKEKNSTIEDALKEINHDLLLLYKEIEQLKIESKSFAIQLYPENYNSLGKDKRRELKMLLGQDSIKGKLDAKIAAKEEELLRLIKYNDYPAMIMAAYPSSHFMDKSKYWNESQNISAPIIVRGIANYKVAQHHRSLGKDYYFVETGYLGNYPCIRNRTGRKIYHRIVKNSMQHESIMDVPNDRWESLLRFNPDLKYNGWKNNGSKILVVLSSEKPFQVYQEDRSQWIDSVIKTLKENTDREIIFREKESRSQRTTNTIYDAFDDVYAVVTYNSIAAVEAIHYGIPAFALAPTAADPVGNKDLTRIENPNKPDEEVIQSWLNSLAYGQFSLDEIITGKAWELVLENEQRSTINT